MKPKSNLRLLNYDDLLVMSCLLSEMTGEESAELLGITPAAVCHRIRKLEYVFGEIIEDSTGRKRRLTPGGEAVAIKINEAIKTMEEAIKCDLL